jgi:thiosulfate/3-mercaptopyruvate sulfurtransferase
MDWLGRMGVFKSCLVVGYDQAGGTYASRLWWMLRWVGHQKVAVLDGGWQAWIAAGHPVTKERPTPTPAAFSGKPDRSWVDVQFVAKHLNSKEIVLIDARSSERFHGRGETIDPVAGHIPGALNRFFKDNLNDQGFFKLPEELGAEFKLLVGNTPPQKIVHQCGSGVSACHNLLAMEIAGLKGTRLYPGSWSEWIADPARPIAA